MRNFAHCIQRLMILALSLLTLILCSSMGRVQKDLTSTRVELEKVVHSISELKRERAKDHNLPKDPTPLMFEYFRVHGLISPHTTDAVFHSIYKEAVSIADQYPQLDHQILLSIIAVESNFYTTCSSDNGHSLGLMQVQPQHHFSRATRLNATDPFSIHDSILVGADYFAEMVDRYGCYSSALVAYNAGPSIANRYHKEGRMTAYAGRVLAIYTDILKIGDTHE